MRKEKRAQDALRKGIFPLILISLLFFPTKVLSQGGKGIEELIRDLQDKNPLVRWTSAEELGRLKDVRAVEPLIAALRDKDEGVRREAAKALGQIGDPRAVEPLGEMLEDKDEFVRMNALWALEKIRSDQAVELIISTLKNDNPLVRMNASASLGRIGDKKAIGPLEEVAGTDHISYVRFAAQQALLQIRREAMEQIAERARMRIEETPPQERRSVAEEKTAELIAEMKKVAERLEKEYGLVLDYMKYGIMDLLDIEGRMKVRCSKDTIEGLLGDLLTEEDKERNKHLFGEKSERQTP
ncbi:MAG: HEAT repeat domain-containing protein [Deltaproteobacteria bacterium]|nr:HEAT repeat domain-containing protein [Deltaproteobacteria bacterium]